MQQLPVTTTTDSLIAELEQLGCGDFDFLRLPVSNHDMTFRGFAFIHYSTVEAATRFIYAASGRVFAGGSCRSTIKIAETQGIMVNLDKINWDRRRRRNTHVCDKIGVGANGVPLARLNGELCQILTREDTERAREIYG